MFLGDMSMDDQEKNIPRHIAIILDGNGRWAKRRGLPRNMGHAEGAKAVERIVYDAADLGIEYLTVYGFSTENWKRPDEEVGALMKILRYYIRRLLDVAQKKNVRVRMIGERSRFSQDIIDGLAELEGKTKDNTAMTFILAINYGGRDEITRGVRRLADEIKAGTVNPEDITEQMISDHLDTAGIPDPDLMIRTSGEQRLSNYLVWQCAYTEFYFTDVLWPDFDKKELEKAIIYYSGRDRRFGGVK